LLAINGGVIPGHHLTRRSDEEDEDAPARRRLLAQAQTVRGANQPAETAVIPG
jgi:hypothetical protein